MTCSLLNYTTGLATGTVHHSTTIIYAKRNILGCITYDPPDVANVGYWNKVFPESN